MIICSRSARSPVNQCGKFDAREHGKQKRVAEEEEEDQSCDGKTVSNEILKGQVRTAKSGRSLHETEGDAEHLQ